MLLTYETGQGRVWADRPSRHPRWKLGTYVPSYSFSYIQNKHLEMQLHVCPLHKWTEEGHHDC